MKVIHILCGKDNPQTTMNGVNVVVDRYANILFERGYDVEVWGIANNVLSAMANAEDVEEDAVCGNNITSPLNNQAVAIAHAIGMQDTWSVEEDVFI